MRSKVLVLLMFFTLIYSLAGTVALADSKAVETSGSSAVQDLIKSDALKGSSSVQLQITTKVGWIFAFIVTVIGFLIVMFTVLKFFLTILYLVFPIMFDKIDAHQRESLQIDFKNSNLKDMVSYVFALIMPNIKSLTDYANGEGDMNVDAWSYMKKRGPAILGFVILGCMIYDGLSRDFIAKAADVSLYIGKRIEGHDTIAFVRRVLDSGEDYEYFYDDTTLAGKNRKKIAEIADSALRQVNPSRSDTTFYTAVGEFVSSTIVGGSEGRISALSGYSIDAIKSLSISARIYDTEPNTNNIDNVEVFQVPQSSEMMNSVKGSKFLVMSFTNIEKEENAVVNGGNDKGYAYDSTNYPSFNLWSLGSTTTIDIEKTHNIVSKGVTSSPKNVRVYISNGALNNVEFTVPVDVEEKQIILHLGEAKSTDDRFELLDPESITRMSFVIPGIEIKPDKSYDGKDETNPLLNWGYYENRQFIYQN